MGNHRGRELLKDIMKLGPTILAISLLTLVGCDKKPSTGSPAASGGASGSTGPSTVKEERAPRFKVELYCETSSPEKGTARYSAWIASSHRSETRDDGQGTTSKKWKTESSKMDFELLDGTKVEVVPTFLGDQDGKDEWRFEVEYEAPDAGDIEPREPVTKLIEFDGETSVVIVEDDSHSIQLRPEGSGTD